MHAFSRELLLCGACMGLEEASSQQSAAHRRRPACQPAAHVQVATRLSPCSFSAHLHTPLACPVRPLVQVAPRMSPFSFWLLRQCAAGSGAAGLTLSQQQAARANAEKALAARIDRLFSEAQEQVCMHGSMLRGWAMPGAGEHPVEQAAANGPAGARECLL